MKMAILAMSMNTSSSLKHIAKFHFLSKLSRVPCSSVAPLLGHYGSVAPLLGHHGSAASLPPDPEAQGWGLNTTAALHRMNSMHCTVLQVHSTALGDAPSSESRPLPWEVR